MDRTADLLTEDLVDEAVLLDARKSREGGCYDRRAEMIAAAGPVLDLDPGTRDGRLDSGFYGVCVRHCEEV